MAIRTVQIRDIGPGENKIRIKVRVCRLWQAKKFKPVVKNDGIRFVLVDEMNDAIHGSIRQGSCELLAPNLIEGNTYEISRFFTSNSQSNFKIVPHPVEIHFTAKTIIRHVPELSASIPLHRFYFVDYNYLPTRTNNEILSDVLGRIKMIQPTEDVLTSDNRIESRCDIYLQNISKEDAQVTLWGDIARSIDADTIKAAGAPAVAVFTSLKVNGHPNKTITLSNTGGTSFFLNLDIKEAQPYKQYFGEPYHAAHILSSRPKQPKSLEELQTVERKSVADLNILDPTKYRNELLYCRAEITRFVPEERWFYVACSKCFKEMRKKPQSQLFFCPDHNMQEPLYRFALVAMITDESDEASAVIRGKPAEVLFGTTCDDLIINKNYKDPNVLPPEILETQGQIKLLELNIGPSQNVIVKGIYEDVEGLTPTQYIQPSSSSTLANIQPSSSTPIKVPSTKKRDVKSLGKQISRTHSNKNLKRDDISTTILESDITESDEDSLENLM